MPRIVLHQWEMSPFCGKVRRCLKHKGLAYEVVNYNGLKAARARGLSAAGQLPVLDWDGERIPDSGAIARFLDARVPAPPLYPAEPQALAAARLWEDWAGQSLYFYEIYFRMLDPAARAQALDLICQGRPRWERAVLSAIFKRRYPKKLAAQGLGRLPRAEVERQFFEHLAGIETLLEGRSFLAGLEPTIADHAVAAQIDEVARTNGALAARIRALPRLAAWLARCS